MTSATAVSRIAVVALALVAGTAAAQPTKNSVVATAQFDQGRALMKDKKYAQACAAFERSQKLEPAPGTLYNLAVCYEKLGKLATAWATFKDLGSRDPNKQRRKAASDAATALAKRVPKLAIEVEKLPPGLVVTLDGTDVTNLVGIDTPVDPGTHVVEARAPKFAAVSKTAKSEEGKRLVISIVLTPEGAGELAQPDPPAVDPPIGGTTPMPPVGPIDAPPKSSRKRNGLLAIGAGGLVVIAGALVGQLASSKWDDARALCGEDLSCANTMQLEQGNQLVSDARLRANLATGMFVGGIALAGIGTYLILSAPKAESKRRAVRVTPSLGRVAGVLVEGRF